MHRTCGEPDEIELTRHGGGIERLALQAVKTMLKAHSNVGFADIDDVTLEATEADAEWGVKAGVSVSTKTVTESTINEQRMWVWVS